MKRILFPILLLATLTACYNNGFPIPQQKFGGIKGKPSIVKESHYDADEKFGEVVPDDLDQVIVYEFNKDGYQIKFSAYDEDGDCDFRVEDIYENGLLVSEISYQSYQNKNTQSKIVERGKKYIKWAHNEGNGDKYFTEMIFEGLSYYANDKDGEKDYEYTFDKAGRVLELKDYDDGELYYRILNEYDKKGLLVKKTECFSSGRVDETTYEYPEFDKKGNWTTQLVYEDGEIETLVKREITYR